MTYDYKMSNTETRSTNFFEFDVSEIEYSFSNKKTGSLETKKVCLIADGEQDALRLIASHLNAGTKFTVSTLQSRKARVQAISPVMKRKMYDALKKEFEVETKSKLFTKKK